MKTHIYSTPGVKEILEYSQVFSEVERTLSVKFRVDTDFGEINDEVIVGV